MSKSCFAIALLSAFLSGCHIVPIVAGGGAVALGAENVAARRGVKGIWYDYSIKSQVRHSWKKKNLESIPCMVYDSVLMIYGPILEDSTIYIEAAREVNGVKKIIDHTYRSESLTQTPTNDDMLLKVKIKGALVSSPSIQSRNLYIRVLNNHVYVLGSTYSEEEKNSIIKTISKMSGVKHFEHYIYIKANDKSILMPK